MPAAQPVTPSPTHPCRDILNKLPEPFDMAVVQRELHSPSPTQVVLLQELERWNVVVQSMKVGGRGSTCMCVMCSRAALQPHASCSCLWA
jgi:hypothetical protein